MLGVAGCAEGFRARKCLCDKAVRGALFTLCPKIVTEHQSVGTRGDRGGCFSSPSPLSRSETEWPPKAAELAGSKTTNRREAKGPREKLSHALELAPGFSLSLLHSFSVIYFKSYFSRLISPCVFLVNKQEVLPLRFGDGFPPRFTSSFLCTDVGKERH